MKEKLTLHHYWRSSCSWRVRWGLALKGIPYTGVPVNILNAEHQGEEFRRKNPTGFLPCLEITGAPAADAILEWLDEVWPTPALLPDAPLARLHVRQLALTIVAGTQPLQNPALVQQAVADEALRKPHMQHWIARGLAVYDTLLQRQPAGAFSYGDSVTLADLCLVPQIYNALRFDVAVPPRLAGIYERCLATPACDAAAPHNQPGAS